MTLVARSSTSMPRLQSVKRNSMAEKANAHQVGGEHYSAHGRPDLQHWDVVAIFGLDYFQGCITKYVFRWRDKNGLEDLIKARHYLDKYIELQQKKA
jgi:hypothetical protein